MRILTKVFAKQLFKEGHALWKEIDGVIIPWIPPRKMNDEEAREPVALYVL